MILFSIRALSYGLHFVNKYSTGKHCPGFPCLILHLLTFIEFLSLGQQPKSTEQKRGTSPSESHSSIVSSLTLGSKQTNKPSSQNGLNCSQEGT